MSNEQIHAPPTPEELERIAARFKVLGEPMRLRILQAICKTPRSVGDIVAATGATQANISKHLALMTRSGMLTRTKSGQNVIYGVKDTLAVKLCELVRSQISNI